MSGGFNEAADQSTPGKRVGPSPEMTGTPRGAPAPRAAL